MTEETLTNAKPICVLARGVGWLSGSDPMVVASEICIGRSGGRLLSCVLCCAVQ